jgi:hypothetical protein
MIVRTSRRTIGAHLLQYRISLVARHAGELLAQLDDAGRSRTRTALRKCQLAPLAQYDRQQHQQGRRDNCDRRSEQATEQSFRERQTHQQVSTGTPIT